MSQKSSPPSCDTVKCKMIDHSRRAGRSAAGVRFFKNSPKLFGPKYILGVFWCFLFKKCFWKTESVPNCTPMFWGSFLWIRSWKVIIEAEHSLISFLGLCRRKWKWLSMEKYSRLQLSHIWARFLIFFLSQRRHK